MKRAAIVWTPEMSVGIDSLDNDHKTLISLLNEYVEATDTDEGLMVTDAIFSSLMSYTKYHFDREEKIIEACGYADLESHHELHDVLRQKVLDYRDKQVLSRGTEMTDEVREFLSSWLQEHILKCDMDYKSSVAGKEDIIAAL